MGPNVWESTRDIYQHIDRWEKIMIVVGQYRVIFWGTTARVPSQGYPPIFHYSQVFAGSFRLYAKYASIELASAKLQFVRG